MNDLLLRLENAYKKCADRLLHPEYTVLLEELVSRELSREEIDYLCDKATSKKHIWEIRLDHLRILLLNESARKFDLKAFYFDCQKRCRRLALKIFYIRGYALYATEKELSPVMEKFGASLEKNHDYIDYEHLLSVAGLPYLAKTYGYDCFVKALQKAEAEYQKIDPLLRGYFTIDNDLKQINRLPLDEVKRRTNAFFEKNK